MRIALAQINPTVGDIAGNTGLILQAIDRARAQGADLVIFPELAVVGYPPKDLLLKEHVLSQSARAVEHIASHCRDLCAIVGFPSVNTASQGRPLRNSAAVCRDGRLVACHHKSLLPTYDVFDETRYFEPADKPRLTELHGMRLGISICEDLWNDPDLIDRQLYHDNPIALLAQQGAELFINCSASPFVIGKPAFRRHLFTTAACRYGLPLAYVNQVGGNDELIFDGNSCLIDAQGRLLAQAAAFQPDLLVADLPPCSPLPAVHPADEDHPDIADVFDALTLGLRDYCAKCGFSRAVLGLSGGIDSAVCAALAVAALGPGRVTGLAMPSRYSSPGSIDDARQLADNLGIDFHVVPIEPAHAAMEQMLAPLFGSTEPSTAEENVQARLRGLIVMAYSNKFGALAITTGNKSELAVGYCTLYGDMAGGLAILADVPKTMVYDLARWINGPRCPLHATAGGPVIPLNSITKPPSAELKPDQTDQDTLPPYEQLDRIVDLYVEREQSADRIIARTGFDPHTVRRVVAMIDRNEYKRKQAAPVLKVTGRAFGSGRRMPIAQRYDPTGQALADLIDRAAGSS